MSSEGCAAAPREQSCAAIKSGPQRHWSELKKRPDCVHSIRWNSSIVPPLLFLDCTCPSLHSHSTERLPRRTQASILPPHPTLSTCTILHSAFCICHHHHRPPFPLPRSPRVPPGSLRMTAAVGERACLGSIAPSVQKSRLRHQRAERAHTHQDTDPCPSVVLS